jgi:hypothetical protein
VCDPRKNSLLKAGNKNDRVDARKLGDLLRAGLLTPVYHGESGVRTLRELSYTFLIGNGKIAIDARGDGFHISTRWPMRSVDVVSSQIMARAVQHARHPLTDTADAPLAPDGGSWGTHKPLSTLQTAHAANAPPASTRRTRRPPPTLAAPTRTPSSSPPSDPLPNVHSAPPVGS